MCIVSNASLRLCASHIATCQSSNSLPQDTVLRQQCGCHAVNLRSPGVAAAAAAAATTVQVRALESSGGLLDAQKLLLCAGVAMQDVGLMFHVSRAMLSAAQELRCLRVGRTMFCRQQ
jgi:hypothetical protein